MFNYLQKLYHNIKLRIQLYFIVRNVQRLEKKLMSRLSDAQLKRYKEEGRP